MSDSLSRRKLARAAAKLAVASASRLPALVLMTDDERLPDPIGAAKALPRGSMVVVRARDGRRRGQLGEAMTKIARARGLFVLIAGDSALALKLGADGVHLPEARIGEAARLRARYRFMVTAAVHSLAALRKTQWLDAAFLSPVLPTASHPGRAALGPLRAASVARQSPVPVFALGGITAANAGRLCGFSGIAAIGALSVS
ncbi:MAG TPA: thiamine phosphate synthase [Rhizomicrobium sp.]|nr:thiamine phosphate synthase [Rhizomicrobium sp.]